MPSKRSQPTKTIDGVVAEQIKALRKAQGSQQRLADLLGVPQSTVTRIESGERGITVGELFRIAAALNVAPVELLGASFQPQDVPVDRTRTLPPPHARAWIRGERPLRDGDSRAYWENISDDEAQFLHDHPSAYRLRALWSEYLTYALADDAVAMDAVLDLVSTTVELERGYLEQRVGSNPNLYANFYESRESRRRHAR